MSKDKEIAGSLIGNVAVVNAKGGSMESKSKFKNSFTFKAVVKKLLVFSLPMVQCFRTFFKHSKQSTWLAV